ncbi:MFS transporter [Natrononativus amylolyticus]|uniref:MFS transporter n=1 Tax=Natrononativus amylolyticus TaxID=2963434 RepID=UPI0020CBDCBD|nr:MFS transporter [Natrononativus amylolyticus]
MIGRRDDAAYVVGAVSGAHFLSHVYLLAYPPLFPVLGSEFDVTTAQLGLLVTAIYVPTLLLQFPLGGVVDSVGAKRVLVAGLVVTSLAITLSGLATAYWMVLACALLSGVGQSVFHPADYALLDSVVDSSNEGLAFSSHTFGGFAGFAAAPVVVGGVGIAYGWQLALVAVGGVGFAYAAAFALTTAPVHARRIRTSDADPSASTAALLAEIRSFVRQLDLLLVFAFYLLSMMAIVGLQSFTTVLAVDAYGFDDATANTLLTAHLASTAVGIVAGGPLANRLPFRRLMIAAFLAAAGGVWLVASGLLDAGFAASVLLFSLIGLLIGLALPSRDRFANAAADPNATGKSFGFFFTGLSLGAVVSPVLLGALIDARSAAAAFLLIGAILLAAVAIVVVALLSGSDGRR